MYQLYCTKLFETADDWSMIKYANDDGLAPASPALADYYVVKHYAGDPRRRPQRTPGSCGRAMHAGGVGALADEGGDVHVSHLTEWSNMQ